MILFAFYAALVWYGCWHYRRRWQGFLVYGLSVFGMYFLWRVYVALVRFSRGGWDTSSMLLLFGAEAFIVLVVGGTLLAVRREKVVMPCRRCRYELEGLEYQNPRCPECGLEHAFRKPRRGRCRLCGERISRAVREAGGLVCGGCEGGEPVGLAAGETRVLMRSEVPAA